MDDSQFKNEVEDMMHIFMRFFGFSDSLKDLWIDPSKNTPYDPKSLVLNGILQTPNFKQLSRTHFDCSEPSLTGAYLETEDTPYPDLYLHHLYFDEALMTRGVSKTKNRKFSQFDLAILKDIGWYSDLRGEFMKIPQSWGR